MVIKNLSNKDRQKLLKALSVNRRIVVVLQKNGHLRIFDVTKYIDHTKHMREQIKNNQPWVKRQKSVLGPIGTQPIGVVDNLSRTAIYEDR